MHATLNYNFNVVLVNQVCIYILETQQEELWYMSTLLSVNAQPKQGHFLLNEDRHHPSQKETGKFFLQMLTSPVTHGDTLVVGPSRDLSDIDCGIDTKNKSYKLGMMSIECILICVKLLKGSEELPHGWDSRSLCNLIHRG